MLLVLGARMCDIHLGKWTNHNKNRNNTWSKHVETTVLQTVRLRILRTLSVASIFPQVSVHFRYVFIILSLYPDSCHYWNCTLECYTKGSFAAMSMPCSQRSLLLVHQPGTSETKSRFSAKQRQRPQPTNIKLALFMPPWPKVQHRA